MKKGGSLKYLIREGFRSVWVNRLMSIASIAVLMACLLIVGCGAMVFFNIQALLDTIDDQNVIMVFVQDTATDYETSLLRVQLIGTDNVEDVIYVSREEAFQEQLDKLGENSSYLDALDPSILPDAFKVEISDMSKYTQTVNTIKGYDGVLQIRESSSS